MFFKYYISICLCLLTHFSVCLFVCLFFVGAAGMVYSKLGHFTKRVLRKNDKQNYFAIWVYQ